MFSLCKKYILLNGLTYNPSEYFTSFERISQCDYMSNLKKLDCERGERRDCQGRRAALKGRGPIFLIYPLPPTRYRSGRPWTVYYTSRNEMPPLFASGGNSLFPGGRSLLNFRQNFQISDKSHHLHSKRLFLALL
jgi:hypothetical protein